MYLVPRHVAGLSHNYYDMYDMIWSIGQEKSRALVTSDVITTVQK